MLLPYFMPMAYTTWHTLLDVRAVPRLCHSAVVAVRSEGDAVVP